MILGGTPLFLLLTVACSALAAGSMSEQGTRTRDSLLHLKFKQAGSVQCSSTIHTTVGVCVGKMHGGVRILLARYILILPLTEIGASRIFILNAQIYVMHFLKISNQIFESSGKSFQ